MSEAYLFLESWKIRFRYDFRLTELDVVLQILGHADLMKGSFHIDREVHIAQSEFSGRRGEDMT